MKINGHHVVQTDVASLWPMLQDEEVLAKISPGVSKIVKEKEHNYKAISDINIGPVRGSFEGDLTLTDVIEHEAMTLNLSQKSKIGNAQATIKMMLSSVDSQQTEIKYEGSAKVSGRLATMGQRILGGVIKTLTKQVFKELDKVIEENPKPAKSAPKTDLDIKQNISDLQSEHKDSSPQTEEKQPKSIILLIIEKIKSIWK